MAILLKATVTAYWVGDGAGPMSVPGAQRLLIQNPTPTVPGEPVPMTTSVMIPTPASLAALDTALTAAGTTMGSAISTQLTSNGYDATMFGWTTGSP